MCESSYLFRTGAVMLRHRHRGIKTASHRWTDTRPESENGGGGDGVGDGPLSFAAAERTNMIRYYP